MNLSAENVGKIRELVRLGYPLKARDAQDLLGHNDHLVELLEARGRLMLGVEIERDQLKAENETLLKDAQRYRWLRDGAGYCDTRDIPGMAPARMDEFIDEAMRKAEQS